MTTALRLVALVLLGSAAACSSPPSLSEADLVDALQRRLAAVRAAGPSEAVAVAPDLDLGPLVGMPAVTLSAALGPSWCGADATPPPCGNATRWGVAFYHLPEGTIGGGTELVVSVDASGRVAAAEWARTQ